MFLYQPPEREKVVRKIRDGAKVSRQDETIKHLAHGWIPSNPLVIRELARELQNGVYKSNREALIQKLKIDPALFAYCARQVASVSEDSPHGHDVFETFRRIEEEKLRTILPLSDSVISPHRFAETSEPHKLLRAQHILFTTVTAEKLAQITSLQQTHAFTSALFFELGLNLIAWNYPRIFTQVMTRHRRYNLNPTRELEKLLGISPIRIGSRFASEFGLSREVLEVLAHDDKLTKPDTLSLREIVRVSALLADAQDSFNFPGAMAAFKADKSPLRAVLTDEVVSELKEQVVSMISPYCDDLSPLQSLPILKSKPEFELGPTQAETLLAQNTFAARLEYPLKNALLELYQLCSNDEISAQALKKYSTQTVEIFRFSRGCLYLLDGQKLVLKPSFRFGETSLAIYDLFLNDLSSGLSSSLYSHSPFCKIAPGVRGTSVLQLSSALDHSRYDGVIYFECDDVDPEFPALLHFQVLRRTLNQLLGDR